jgi:hypothetical protein
MMTGEGMPNKQFSERLNKELDDMGVPEPSNERVEILAKLLKVPRFKAEALLSGHTHFEAPILEMLAEELEVSTDWLLGKSDKRQN